MKRFMSLIYFLTLCLNVTQSQPWSYDFGTGSSSSFTTSSGVSTTFLPQPSSGEDRIRVSDGDGGGFYLYNQGLKNFGSNAELQIVASTSGSANKFSIYNYTAGKSFYTRFLILLGDNSGGTTASSGEFYFFQGAGSTYSNNNTFFGNEVFTGIQWVFGSSGSITMKYRNGSGWSSLGSTPFTQGNIYTVEIFGNNTTGTINYNYKGASMYLASNKQDIYVNGTIIGDELSKALLSNDTYIDSWMFYGVNSNGNVANIFIDNIVYSNSIPLPETTWNGSTWDNGSPTSLKNVIFDGNYTTSGNFSAYDVVINSGKALTISEGNVVTVENNLTNNAGNSGIVIKSSSSGTGNLIHNTQNVAATVERYVTGNATYEPYHFICSPVKNLAFSSIWQSNDYNVYWYDEATSGDIDEGWTRILSGNLVNGRGYAVVSNYANRTFSWQGNLLVPDDFSSGMSVSYTNNGYLNADGWNLIGNPYPCGLKVSEFLSDNSGKFASGYEAVYLWDNPAGDRQRADYAIRNSSGGTAASGGSNITPDADIAVGQGFFVKVGSGTTSITLAADQREAYSGTQFFIPDFENPLRSWLSVEGPDNSYNEILCAFLPEATNGFDQKYDAAKLRGNPNIALYSFIHDSELQFAIQGLSLTSLINDEEVAVPVGIYAGEDGIYHFQVSKKENIDDILIEIEDKLTGERYRLSNGENVAFELTQGEHNDRFILHFLKNSLATRENKTGKPQIRYMHESLYLNNLTPENYEKLRIVNVMGQEITVFNKNQLNNSSIEMKGLSQGYYIYFLEGKRANISGGFIVR
ncbi:MAG: hypothetical protein GX437_03115 [Sphingobacteriales bacterium]|nr:hypothetical protein [Sphingobacteriales bacterium]